MWTIHDVSPTLRPYANRIASAIEAARSRIARHGDVRPSSFSLKANRSQVIGRLGLGGFCGDANSIRLSFDPKNPNMHDNLDETLERSIAHEYHHALRWAGPGYGAKLGAQLVTEGLAGQFVREIYDSPPEPWEAALDQAELAPWRTKAFDMFEARDHRHARWFFGADGMPPWLGYTLGYDLVGRHIERNGGSALSLAYEPYTSFKDALLT